MAEQIIELELIEDNPYQERTTYKDIESLARTIASDDLQQKPKVRLVEGKYQLKFGHRRLRAFQWLNLNWKKEKLPERYNGYSVMPVEIEVLSDEEMKRGATIENSQRNDLSPIEKMEEIKSWVARGYNSKQIAEMYPGMTDSTVRGFLYFDQAIDEIKQVLHKGEITQGAARDLIAAQKIAPIDRVLQVLKEIIENKPDMFGDIDTPEQRIEILFEDLPDTIVAMWHDRQDGKPRAGSRWLLDMKNFPNKFLPALTLEDAMKALGTDNKQTIKKIEAWLVDQNNVEGLDEKQIEILNHLVNPSACSACPFYVKFKGSHYCGKKVCYERKGQAWEREELRTASKTLGIEIYNAEQDGDFLVLDDTYNNEQHKGLFKRKNRSDLRLALAVDIDRKKSQYGYDGVPSAVRVIVVGETLKELKAPVKTDGKGNIKVTSEIQAHKKKEIERVCEKLLYKKRDLLRWEATIYVTDLFVNFKPQGVQALFEAPYGWSVDDTDLPDDVEQPDSDAKESVKTNFTLRLIAFNMLETRSEFKTLPKYASMLIEIAKTWGVKIPARFLKLAEQMEAEIKEAVVAETAKK